MKRLILSLFLCLLWAATADAQQLVCDIPSVLYPQADVEITEIQAPDRMIVSETRENCYVSNGAYILKDLSRLSWLGKFSIRARYVSQYGFTGEYSAPVDFPTHVDTPQALRIIMPAPTGGAVK